MILQTCGGERSLVEAEFTEMIKDSAPPRKKAKIPPVNETDRVVPFDYAAARAKKKEKCEQSSTSVVDRWRNECPSYPKAKKNRSKPKSGNRSGTFSAR